MQWIGPNEACGRTRLNAGWRFQNRKFPSRVKPAVFLRSGRMPAKPLDSEERRGTVNLHKAFHFLFLCSEWTEGEFSVARNVQRKRRIKGSFNFCRDKRSPT
ncbi:hypothetical protein SKAU_G00242460 [Synaphobranchus kaupii]|uniref:Uncharacterized protein n=1 Tax=Synaphobranchus kaupii TaxID=118154 RepID=A0A9Q1F822_SYNKA|nr:hypothetical protein SKAU_G00242460 [Synaphobranchus kaupii]